jgi:uncharacterized protein (TIGR00369 family)
MTINDGGARCLSDQLRAAQETLEATRASEHPNCVLCGTENGFGLGLRFRVCALGKVRAEFACHPILQSYPEMLHGGFAAALLDAAMTNCLFSLGIVAVTAELTVRYLRPINLHDHIEVHAAHDECRPPVHNLSSEVQQNGKTVVRAWAKFFEIESRVASRDNSHCANI